MERQALGIGEIASRHPGTVTPSQLDRAVAILDAGAPDGRRVLLHRDLHAGNVLRSNRGWLAIDPKPHVGPSWCDLGMALVSWTPRPAQVSRLCAALDLDRTRVVDYAFAICIVAALWNRSVGQDSRVIALLDRATELG
jgi:streptomycin 6-kinase